jgi:hypothetical protein
MQGVRGEKEWGGGGGGGVSAGLERRGPYSEFRAKCETGDGGDEKVGKGGGESKEVGEVFFHQFYELVQVCFGEVLHVFVANVVGKKDVVLAEYGGMVGRIELLAEHLDVVGCRPDEVYRVQVLLNTALTFDAIKEKNSAHNKIRIMHR